LFSSYAAKYSRFLHRIAKLGGLIVFAERFSDFAVKLLAEADAVGVFSFELEKVEPELFQIGDPRFVSLDA
jgi:hypothetical protein